ncbi:MAG: hypothetical protein ACO31W_06585 [Gemmatimonadaceae bacterium]
MHIEDPDVRGPHDARIRGPLLLDGERALLGMRAAIRLGERRHHGIGQQEGGVPRDEIADIERLAEEGRVVVGAIVVGDVELVKAPVELREEHRGATDTDPLGLGADPEDGIRGDDDELGARRGRRDIGAGEQPRRDEGEDPSHAPRARAATPSINRATSSSVV